MIMTIPIMKITIIIAKITKNNTSNSIDDNNNYNDHSSNSYNANIIPYNKHDLITGTQMSKCK